MLLAIRRIRISLLTGNRKCKNLMHGDRNGKYLSQDVVVMLF